MSPRKLATPAVIKQHKWALSNGVWVAIVSVACPTSVCQYRMLTLIPVLLLHAGLCLNHMAHHLSQRSDRWKHPVGFARVPPISIDQLPRHARALLGEK